MPVDTDRRKNRRLPLRLPLVLSGEYDGGRFIEKATCENVSAGGVYFRTDGWCRLPVGARVQVAIVIAGEHALFAHTNKLRTVGRVVRWSEPTRPEGPSEGVRGVAVQFERALQFAT